MFIFCLPQIYFLLSVFDAIIGYLYTVFSLLSLLLYRGVVKKFRHYSIEVEKERW